MKIYSVFIYLLLFIVLTIQSAIAQDNPQIKHQFGATFQVMASYQQGDSVDNSGFGLRRMRVRHYGSYNDKVKSFVQADLASGSLGGKLVDMRLEYYFSPDFYLKTGRFVGAGPRAGALTSHGSIDIIERSFTAETWAAASVGSDYRDFGIQAEWKINNFQLRAMTGNGSGALNILNKAGDEASTKIKPAYFSGMVIYMPDEFKGLELGGHMDKGNKDIKEWNSWSAFIYYKSQKFQLKTEVINLENAQDITLRGYYLFGGYNLNQHIELLARVENYDPDIDQGNDGTLFITAGAALREFPETEANRLTVALVYPVEEGNEINNLTVQLMWQFMFKTN
jgi:hypothetical protein